MASKKKVILINEKLKSIDSIDKGEKQSRKPAFGTDNSQHNMKE